MAFQDLVFRMASPFWNVFRARMSELMAMELVKSNQRLAEMIQQIESTGGIVEPRAAQLRDPGHRWQTLQIGITDLCNLVCRHCGRTPNQKDLFGILDIFTFSKYLSRFSPDWFHELLISDWGEPTMVKNLLDYLYLAKRTGWNNVQFFTNGACKKDWMFEQIVSEKLLGALFVSVEATSPDLYESIRTNKFEVFDHFIRNIARLREYYESPMNLFFNTVCMRENLHELPGIMRLAAELNVNKVQIVHVYVTMAQNLEGKLCRPDQMLDTMDRKEVLAVFEKVVRLAGDNNIPLSLPEPFPELTGSKGPDEKADEENALRCTEPLRWVQVGFTGDIYPCCKTNKTYSMGNINNLDFGSIYDNLRYKKLLKTLRQGEETMDFCKGCSVLEGKTL